MEAAEMIAHGLIALIDLSFALCGGFWLGERLKEWASGRRSLRKEALSILEEVPELLGQERHKVALLECTQEEHKLRQALGEEWITVTEVRRDHITGMFQHYNLPHIVFLWDRVADEYVLFLDLDDQPPIVARVQDCVKRRSQLYHTLKMVRWEENK